MKRKHFQLTRIEWENLTHQAQLSKVFTSFDDGVHACVRTLFQNKLMTNYTAGPGGSLTSIDVFNPLGPTVIGGHYF